MKNKQWGGPDFYEWLIHACMYLGLVSCWATWHNNCSGIKSALRCSQSKQEAARLLQRKPSGQRYITKGWSCTPWPRLRPRKNNPRGLFGEISRSAHSLKRREPKTKGRISETVAKCLLFALLILFLHICVCLKKFGN